MNEAVITDDARAIMRLSAGRIRAMEIAPYLSMALLALEPVPKPGLGTFAVDAKWRVYYDPALCLRWTIDEIAAVWLHEMNHVFRDHSKRFKRFNNPVTSRDWNVSADAAINSDLKDMDVVLPNPETRYYAAPSMENPTWEKGMTAEQMYRERTGTSGFPGEEEQPGGVSDDDDSGDAESSEDDSPGDESHKQQEGDDEGIEECPQEDAEDAEGEDAEGDEGEGEGEDGTSSPSEGDGEDDSTEEEGEGDGDGEGEGTDGDGEESQDDTSGGEPNSGSSGDGESQEDGDGEPANGEDDHDHGSPHGDCGSGADGIPREFENINDREYPGVDEGRVDIIKQEVARAIVEYDKSRPGTVPGGMKRAADDILDPKADWERLLYARVRRIVAHIVGKADYSYARPSRRQHGSNFIFPALRGGHEPIIYIIIDTSGSMEPRDLARALSEIAGIIRRARGRVYVVICDSATKGEVSLVRRLEDIELVGGGGTDMRVGIRLAAESKPRPDIILTITDGFTPWITAPEPLAPRAAYLALIVTPRNKEDAAPIKNIPDFMSAVVVSH